MADDPVADLLRKYPLTQSQRADLWDAYHASGDLDALTSTLKPLWIPPPVKAALWDLKSKESASPATPAAAPSTLPRTWGDTALDVAKGFGKGAARTGMSLVEGVTQLPPFAGSTMALDALRANPAIAAKEAQVKQALQSTNAPQAVGGALETAAEFAIPLGAAAEAIPTTAKAGAKFQSVMAAAKDVPVNVNAPGQVALRIQELAERGGSMPMAVRKFLNRVTDPNQAQLTYEEARDFASNISRLSANEYQRLTPAVAREVANLRVTLNHAVGQAASAVGKGQEYAAAMTEYARAMKIRNAVDAAIEGAKRSVPYATAAGAGYWLTSHLRKLLSDE